MNKKYRVLAQSIMAFPIKIPSMSASRHGFSIAALANKTRTLISSPGSIVDHTNHNRRRHWINENIVFMGLEQGLGRCLVSVPSPVPAFTHCPFVLQPSAKETACEALAPDPSTLV